MQDRAVEDNYESFHNHSKVEMKNFHKWQSTFTLKSINEVNK